MCNKSFQRLPIPPDWERFHFYAHRIRRFGFSPRNNNFPCSQPLDETVLQTLSRHKPAITLLPNVRYLAWKDDDIFSYLHLFLSPSVTHFTWNVSPVAHNEDNIAVLFDTLKNICPAMEHLHLSLESRPLSAKVHAALSNLVSSLHGLRSLECASLSLTNAALDHLAHLPTLREVSMDLDANYDMETLSSKHTFSQILSIDAGLADLAQLNTLINVTASSQMDTISARLRSSPPAPLLWETFESLHHHPSRNSIEKIFIEQTEERPPNHEDYFITANTLRPLLAFSQLTVVTINLNCPFDFDNSLLADMAGAWPQLVQLELITYYERENVRISLGGLISLIAGCPKLRSLGVVLDARITGFWNGKRPGLGYTNSAMRSLTFGYSPIGNPTRVASFLSDVFPNVSFIDVLWDGEDENPARRSNFYRWKEAERLIQVFREVRNEERNWRADSAHSLGSSVHLPS